MFDLPHRDEAVTCLGSGWAQKRPIHRGLLRVGSLQVGFHTTPIRSWCLWECLWQYYGNYPPVKSFGIMISNAWSRHISAYISFPLLALYIPYNPYITLYNYPSITRAELTHQSLSPHFESLEPSTLESPFGR